MTSEMTSEMTKTEETVESTAEIPLVESKTEEKLVVIQTPKAQSSNQEQWRQFGEKTSVLITDLQNSAGEFFENYKPLLGSLAWIFAILVSVKLTLALLDAINDIPLLDVSLELIGLGYVVWFIYRYLLTASSRQELSGEFNNLKKQVFNLES
ncbi:MAG TPA: CAAD domain-containing protein [Waterburya sp.]|jgi:hypothetical protein